MLIRVNFGYLESKHPTCQHSASQISTLRASALHSSRRHHSCCIPPSCEWCPWHCSSLYTTARLSFLKNMYWCVASFLENLQWLSITVNTRSKLASTHFTIWHPLVFLTLLSTTCHSFSHRLAPKAEPISQAALQYTLCSSVPMPGPV